VLAFRGIEYPLSSDFDAGSTISKTFSIPPINLIELNDGMRYAMIYSNADDTWRCSEVTISGRTSEGRWFTFTQETSEEARNSNGAGNGDNPVTFHGFEPRWDSPKHWMSNNMALLGSKKLSGICMPGAHDAGMYISQVGTFGATPENTITQVNDIYGMLCLGVRYFDIRPIIGGGEFYTGHYSKVSGLGHQGARGDSIASIVEQINRFSAEANELIILDLSHDMNTDADYESISTDKYKELLESLSSIKGLRTIGSHPTSPTIQDILGAGEPTVILRVDWGSRDEGFPSEYPSKGIYSYDQWSIVNKYSGTPSWKTMSEDQLDKMCHGYGYFLLSWTLTQNTAEALGLGASILDLAKGANKRLDDLLRQRIESEITEKPNDPVRYPQIILQDAIEDPTAATLSMWINARFA